jgi:hypothetical protein
VTSVKIRECVMCFGCGGECRGLEHQSAFYEKLKGKSTYEFIAPRVFRPVVIAVDGESGTLLTSFCVGLMEQIQTQISPPIGVLLPWDMKEKRGQFHVFFAELLAEGRLLAQTQYAQTLPVVQDHERVSITVSEPVRDIFLLGQCLTTPPRSKR